MEKFSSYFRKSLKKDLLNPANWLTMVVTFGIFFFFGGKNSNANFSLMLGIFLLAILIAYPLIIFIKHKRVNKG